MKLKILSLSFCIGLLLTACSQEQFVKYSTIDEVFTLTFKKGFTKTSDNPQADLQCASRDGSVNMLFFSYNKMDFAESVDAEELLKFQIEDLAGKRTSFDMVGEESYSAGDKTVLEKAFLGVKDNKFKYYYVLSGISFKNDENVILIVLQITSVTKYESNKEMMRDVLRSAEVNVNT